MKKPKLYLVWIISHQDLGEVAFGRGSVKVRERFGRNSGEVQKKFGRSSGEVR